MRIISVYKISIKVHKLERDSMSGRKRMERDRIRDSMMLPVLKIPTRRAAPAHGCSHFGR